MKLKLLLLLMLFGGVLTAQDTIRTLLITEARMTHPMENYVEITNIGDFEIQLGEFEFGLIRPYNNVPWTPEDESRYFRLPERILEPGASYVISTAYDLGPKLFKMGSDDYQEKITRDEIWNLADILLHAPEALHEEAGDSITEPHYLSMFTYSGRGAWYLRQHLTELDSVVVDQVGGVFDQENGLNSPDGLYDVAGVEGATGNSILVRKFSVKTGNLDFANARGIGIDDSEWMPIPIQGGFAYDDQRLGHWRSVPWTLGNHGDYNLDENTLESDVIDVDFDAKTLTIPWGIRSNDDIMNYFEKKPGVAWAYDQSPVYEDSLYMSARTGDKLTVYVCGTDLDMATFDIVVEDPAENANIVMAKYNVDPEGEWRTTVTQGQVDWPRISQNAQDMDTITGAKFGIPYATRVDSLVERLEKAPEATWEFVWVDGVERADLMDGDILRVTAQNGESKEYYIKVGTYRTSHNAYLSAITWPDIPEWYKDIFGWMGDTIPGFTPSTYNFKVEVPLDVQGIPALVAKTEDLNAKITAKRATTLDGTDEQRTLSYTVQAEDDTTFRFYNIEFVKEKDPVNIQPYHAEPFISEYVFWYSWAPTNFFEICNPGNQMLDLSNYMFVGIPAGDPVAAITAASDVDGFGSRYNRYVPGYKWVSQADWSVSPSILEPDLNVNPLVAPGDVFVLGQTAPWTPLDKAKSEIDIDFINNPWGESINPWGQSAVGRWKNHNWYLFKILNDSIKRGLKPVGDLEDFELIEVFGTGDGTDPQPGVGYVDMVSNLTRKPNYTEGRTQFNESFQNPPDSEWDYKSFLGYWLSNGVGNKEVVTWDLGTHYFIEPTHYKSTVSSVVYKVSEGYSMDEQIRGAITGTTVSEFIDNIIQADENQMLKVVSVADGMELANDAALTMNDTLVVLSADSTNTTKYVLEVSDEGLSSNAVLTSEKYTIMVEGEVKSAGDHHMSTGSVSGFEYGTALKTVLVNVTVPAGASLSVIDNEGLYVPLNMLNFDTAYVDVTVNHNTYFEVIAEDGVTTIVYQLQPEVSDATAFITSDVYSVSQRDLLIEFIPRGTNVQVFLSNIIPSLGAEIMLVDKMGMERTNGAIKQDDRLVVTSPDGSVQKVYFLSMLRTEFIQSTVYLAYVTSSVYAVDQVEMSIGGATGQTSLDEFYSRIKPSMGATAVVVDADGMEKTTGDLDDGDMLKVTSADGMVTAMYSLSLNLTYSNLALEGQFELYPNPTDGRLNIQGVSTGQTIRVINSVGATVRLVKAQGNIEQVNLNNEPAGLYFVIITDNYKKLAQFKALKR